MINTTKDDLLKELEIKFAEVKKVLGFKAGFDDLERIFFLRDMILKEGFVPDTLSRMICRRIVDTYMSWAGYLHSLIVPNPSSMIAIGESQMFDDNEKEDMSSLINMILSLVSENNIIGLTRDKKKEGMFIDRALSLWDEILPKMTQFVEKVNKGWVEKVDQS